MKIRITIEAVNDEDETVSSRTGEIDAKESATGVHQWFMETFTTVKMDAIFNKSNEG